MRILAKIGDPLEKPLQCDFNQQLVWQWQRFSFTYTAHAFNAKVSLLIFFSSGVIVNTGEVVLLSKL